MSCISVVSILHSIVRHLLFLQCIYRVFIYHVKYTFPRGLITAGILCLFLSFCLFFICHSEATSVFEGNKSHYDYEHAVQRQLQ